MATYIDNNVKFHAFSKSPVSPDTTLGGAVNPSGHTITTSQVRSQDIPAFLNTFQGTKEQALTWVAANYTTPAHNDIVYYGGEFKTGFSTPKCLKYNAKAETPAWEDFDITTAGTLNNADDKPVIKIHQDCSTVFVDGGNNAATNSNRWSLFVKKSDGTILDHFVASTDKIVAGMPSLGYNALVLLNDAAIDEGELDANYVGNTFAGIIHLNKQYANGDDAKFKVTCFEYIGEKLDTTVADLAAAVFGEGGAGDDDASLTQKVAQNTAAIAKLNGTGDGSVAKAVSEAEGRVKVTTDALAGRIAQLEGIQHFSVVVCEGTTLPETPVENTIYLVSDANAADGSYIEYIAFKQGETVVTEKIGSTKIDLSGYTTDAEHEALADRVTALDSETGRVAVVEGKVNTLVEETVPALQQSIVNGVAEAKGHAETKATEAKEAAINTAATALATARDEISQAIADAKAEAIASAEVTITAGTGIVVTGEGKGTTFQIAVSDEVATAAALSALSQVVASNKTELEGKIAEASAAATAALENAVAEIGTTTTGLDTRLTAAEGNVTALQGEVAALTSGENSVDSKITAAKTELEGKITTAQNTLQGNIDGVSGRVDTIVNETIPGVKAIAEEAKGLAETAVQSASGDDYVALDKSGTAITATTNITAIDTALAAESATVGGAIKAAADAAAKAADDASKALETAQAQTLDQTGTLEGMFSVATVGTVGTGIESITITDTGLSTAISAARTDAVADVKALTLTASDSDDAGKVTVTLGGTVETPILTVTSSDIASAQTLADLQSTVNTHIAEAAGLYLSVEKVDTLPADADAKTNKIYLVPVDTEAGRAQNIHTEYIWTNGKWEIIGTTAIDINSLEEAAEAAQSTADTAVANAATAQAAAEAAQGEVDALETVVETLTQTHADDKAAIEASIDEINTTIEELDATETVNGLTVTQVDGKITGLTDSLITASVPADTTSVEGNVAYVGSTKHVIAPEKFQTAAQMPETLTTWVADLSNLTVGDNMFKGTALTTFIGDLSALTSGVDMFAGCSLTVESVEFIADTLPTVTSGTITLGTTTEAHADAIADIQAKGWTVA